MFCSLLSDNPCVGADLSQNTASFSIGKVWIYRLLFVFLFVCAFERLRISPSKIKLAASNFARWFIGVHYRESPIFVNFASQKPKIGRIGQRVKDDKCSSWWLLNSTACLSSLRGMRCGLWWAGSLYVKAQRFITKHICKALRMARAREIKQF